MALQKLGQVLPSLPADPDSSLDPGTDGGQVSGNGHQVRGSLSKKARLLRAYLTGKPVWVTWQATYNCNYGCTFCDYWKNDFKPSEENSLEDFRIGSEKLAELGSMIISIAGGEPLLRRDLNEVVRILARQHFPFMTTTGSGLTENRARGLWEAGLWGCSISIDYADPELHGHHRGAPHAYSRALTAIERLLKTRTDTSYQRVMIISMLSHDNLDQMEGLCKLAADLGVYWHVQPYSPMKTGDEDLRHQPNATKLLLDLKKRYPQTVHANRVYLEGFDQAANGGIPGCIAGKAMFNIDNRMVVSKCVEFNETEPCGNLRTDSMKDLLGRLRKAHSENKCLDCWYSCRGEVEILYQPRGFLHSMPTYLWQNKVQQS